MDKLYLFIAGLELIVHSRSNKIAPQIIVYNYSVIHSPKLHIELGYLIFTCILCQLNISFSMYSCTILGLQEKLIEIQKDKQWYLDLKQGQKE